MTTPRQMEPAIVARAVNSRLRVCLLYTSSTPYDPS